MIAGGPPPRRAHVERILVVAGSARQAADNVREAGLLPGEYRYVSDSSVLRGTHRAPIAYVGRYWDNRDLAAIREFAAVAELVETTLEAHAAAADAEAPK